MRKSRAFVSLMVASVVIFAGWGGFAQVKENAKDKPAATGKKPAETAKPAGEATKKPADTAKPAGETTKKPAANTVPQPAGEQADSPEEAAEEAAIRKGARAFVAAYNAHDAKAVAQLFAIKAEITDEDGRLVKGRDAIEKDYARVFEAFPESKIKVEVDSIRVLTPNIAVEEGIVKGQQVPDGDENVSTYVAVHAKVEGRWLIGSVKDFDAGSEQPLTANGQLQQLAWLVGEWVEESPETVIHTVCRWHDNDNFLMQEFRVQVAGQTAMSGTMRIGWDAVRKQFKSWVFDSHGGHSEGYWLRNGDEWIVKAHGATAAGETVSATYVHRRINDDTRGWRAFDRVLDGELQDEIPEIVVKRRPPSPVEE
jgi:uncharacterized protein (TIGR02246 family)